MASGYYFRESSISSAGQCLQLEGGHYCCQETCQEKGGFSSSPGRVNRQEQVHRFCPSHSTITHCPSHHSLYMSTNSQWEGMALCPNEGKAVQAVQGKNVFQHSHHHSQVAPGIAQEGKERRSGSLPHCLRSSPSGHSTPRPTN